MKKMIVLLLSLLLIFSLTACGQKENVQYYVTKRQLIHDTGDVNLTTYQYNEDWKVIGTETLLNGNFASRVDYAYSEDGTVVTQNFTSATSAPSSTEHHSVYDENGNILESSSYHDGQLTGVSRYTYDKKGQEIKLEGFDPNGNLTTTITRSYDDRGNLLTIATDYGTRVSRHEYTYNSNNQRLTTHTYINNQLNSRVEYIWEDNSCFGTLYTPEGTPIAKTLSVQDKAGNLLMEESYDILGTLQNRTYCEYTGTDGNISSGFPTE